MFQVNSSKCACGCGRSVKEGSTFRMGHDAKLKAQLIKIHGYDLVHHLVTMVGTLPTAQALGFQPIV